MIPDRPALITPEDSLLRALTALERGEPVQLCYQGETAIIAAIETLTAVRLAALYAYLQPACTVAITARRAAVLKARAYDGDLARIKLTQKASLTELHVIADPTCALDKPLSGPYLTERQGNAVLERMALRLCRRARLLPAALVWHDAVLNGVSEVNDQTIMALEPGQNTVKWREVTFAKVPIAANNNTTLRLMRRIGGDQEHYVVEVGRPKRSEPVLTRLHSACATGDIFGSLKCDCGPQLAAALEQMGQAGGGMLVYLLQEGRGIGLANKLRAYRLQEMGYDTVEANHRLGFDDDERLLGDGGEILQALGVSAVQLITNNPAKIAAVEAAGVKVVDRVPLQVGRNILNEAYLQTKAAKSGHLL